MPTPIVPERPTPHKVPEVEELPYTVPKEVPKIKETDEVPEIERTEPKPKTICQEDLEDL